MARIAKDMTLEMAEAEIGGIIYTAALYFEKLEDLGLIHGNGHHIAQDLSESAKRQVRSRWIKPALPSRLGD